MADRIFPTTKQEKGIASEKEFTGIDWQRVANFYQENTEKEASKLPEGFRELLSSTDEDIVTAEVDAKETDTVKQDNCTTDDENNQDKKPQKGRFDGTEMPEEKRKLKVHFSKAEQISADAIKQAKEEGQDELVLAQLAARQQRRTMIASRIIESEKEQDTQVKLAKRQQYREALLDTIEDTLNKKGTTEMTNTNKIKISVSKSKKAGFKTVAAMSSKEQTAFREAALESGFPVEYVDAILESKTTSTGSETVDQIKEVMSSTLPINTKKAALSGLIRTAELDEANKERLIRYWVDDLQYGDEEWVRNWINKKY